MQTEIHNRPTPIWARALVVIITALFVVIQGWTLFGPEGILSRYSFMEGFTVFNTLMLADPLLSAGLFDLIFLELAFLIILLNGIPRGPAYPFIFLGFVLAMIVYPALGGLGFLMLYWRRLGQFRP